MCKLPAPSTGVCNRLRATRVLSITLLFAVAAAALTGCNRKERSDAEARAEAQVDGIDRTAEGSADASPTPTPRTRRITAAWYPVPPQSLAKRRAPDELTAAHNTLPLGTRVRVTNPDNGRTVTVRITDRGIRDRRVKLDVCKEAAEELGMVRDGFADLKMQVLPEDGPATMVDAPTIAADTDQSPKTE